MSMEYKKERREKLPLGEIKNPKTEISRLIIEENTIYEIDLDCQKKKGSKCSDYNSKGKKL